LAPLAMLALAAALRYEAATFLAIAISALALAPGGVCVVLEAGFVARERAEFVTLGTTIESVLRIALSMAALNLGGGVLTLMGILVASRCGLLFVYWLVVRELVAPEWHFHRRRAWRFAVRWRVFAAENWLATIYTSLDVLILSAVAGEAAVGLYSAAWKFVRLGTVIAKSYTTAVFPVMSRLFVESRESFQRLLKHTIRIMCTLALPLVIGTSILAERIVGLLYTAEFAEAAPLLRILIWVLLLDFLNPFLSHTLFAQKRQHRSLQVAAISLSVSAISMYVLVHFLGAAGVAWGCVLGSLVATCAYLFFLMSRSELVGLLVLGARVLLAAAGLGGVIYVLRAQPLVPLVGASLAVYAPLLFVVQALRLDDLRFLSTTLRNKATA
ncbi:MAG: oligosaccharide flippase family protein, partial [Pirellulaceae bacterium]